MTYIFVLSYKGKPLAAFASESAAKRYMKESPASAIFATDAISRVPFETERKARGRSV